MIRTENLRSGYIQDDVEEYLYQLLPERDAVIAEIEDYAAQNRVPIIGPAVARLMALLVEVSGAKRIFEMGSAIGYSRSGKGTPRERLFSAGGRGQTGRGARRQRAGTSKKGAGQI